MAATVPFWSYGSRARPDHEVSPAERLRYLSDTHAGRPTQQRTPRADVGPGRLFVTVGSLAEAQFTWKGAVKPSFFGSESASPYALPLSVP
jgi:hypothetical protein